VFSCGLLMRSLLFQRSASLLPNQRSSNVDVPFLCPFLPGAFVLGRAPPFLHGSRLLSLRDIAILCLGYSARDRPSCKFFHSARLFCSFHCVRKLFRLLWRRSSMRHAEGAVFLIRSFLSPQFFFSLRSVMSIRTLDWPGSCACPITEPSSVRP